MSLPDFDPYHPPAAPSNPAEPDAPPADPRLNALGGWLILVGFGIVVSPFRVLIQVNNLVQFIFFGDTWKILTTPGGERYHHLWAPFLVSELLVNAITFVVWTFLAYLFFTKKKAFPKWYIWAHASTLAFVVADAFALRLVRPDLSMLDPETAKEIARSLLIVCVWVPYMIKSKRVAATFTR